METPHFLFSFWIRHLDGEKKNPLYENVLYAYAIYLTVCKLIFSLIFFLPSFVEEKQQLYLFFYRHTVHLFMINANKTQLYAVLS